ncbi:MAG: MFS transporter [Chloroflexi bacterium]|nr:MFS transporter [Chloroflexota bacterium]
MAVVAQAQPVEAARGTFAALRNPDYRLYFAGLLISQSGTWMQNIAQGYLVYSLTGSEAWLGLVALAMGLPLLLVSPLAGVMVERAPRRRVLQFTQSAQMLLAITLTILAATGTVAVWHVVLLAFILGVISAFDAPARMTLIAEIVTREDLSSGITLGSILNSSTRVLGPTAAGLVLARFGVVWCFALNAVSFLAVIGCLALMRVPYAIPAPKTQPKPLRQLREGFAYVRGDRAVMSILLLASVTGFFLLPILQMLPAVAEVTTGSHSDGYALLSAAEGLGALVAGLTTSYLAMRFSRGRLIAAATLLNAALMTVLGFQNGAVPAALLTMLTGFALIMLMVNMNTGLQLMLPNAFRSRAMSLYMLTLMGLSPFGALALGTLAELVGIAPALAVFGLIAGVLGGWIVLQRHPGQLDAARTAA